MVYRLASEEVAAMAGYGYGYGENAPPVPQRLVSIKSDKNGGQDSKKRWFGGKGGSKPGEGRGGEGRGSDSGRGSVLGTIGAWVG